MKINSRDLEMKAFGFFLKNGMHMWMVIIIVILCTRISKVLPVYKANYTKLTEMYTTYHRILFTIKLNI